jgi:hypothetical protein
MRAMWWNGDKRWGTGTGWDGIRGCAFNEAVSGARDWGCGVLVLHSMCLWLVGR